MRNALSAPQASIGPHEAGAGATPRERALAGPLMSLAAVSLSSDPAHHEQGYPQEYIKTFATAPTFSEMLDEARRGERNNPIDYEPLAVNAKGEWIIDTKRVPTTEGELLLDLANFLDRAEVAVTAEGDEERRTAVQHMRDNVPFLGKEEFNTATAGIADYWIDYLHSDPANKIFVFSPAGHATKEYWICCPTYH